MKHKDIEILQARSQTHAQTLSKEAAETAEMQSAIASLTATLTTHSQTKTQLLAQIAQTQSLIAQKQSQQRAHAAALSAQSAHDIPELDFWTQHLGMRVEGAGVDDRLKFVFWNLDEREWKREAWFVLDCESREYKIRQFRPKLDGDRVNGLVDGFNEGRELGPLLKGMRDLFVEAMKAGS